MQEDKRDEEIRNEIHGEVEESHSTCAWDMAMTMRRTKHKLEPLEPQWDQSCKQRTVQPTKTTLTTKKRHYKQTSSTVVQSTTLTNLQLVFSWVSTCFKFAATFNMLLCLSLCIRVINSLIVNVHTYSFFTCMWIPCRIWRFSHCENGSFEVLSSHSLTNRSPPTVNDLSATKKENNNTSSW